MFKFFRKLFMKDDNVKKFEIEIYDRVIQGEPPYEKTRLEKVHYDKPVIIEAKNKKDLDDFAEKLKLCNQTFKIIRVINDSNNTSNKQVNNQQSTNAVALEHSNISNPVQTTHIEHKQLLKPKFYKIGDIEIKDDNGKIYQKQWIKLNDSEASNFRIVNDKSNAIFQLKDRHIEMKRWVLVENSDMHESSLENIEKEITESGEAK